MQIFKCALLVIFLITTGSAQDDIDKKLRRFNKGSVPYVSVAELKLNEVILLDTREKEEYEISHLKEAVWVGHKEFSIDSVLKYFPNKDKSVVVYCSIGVRSEIIGEKMIKAGFTDVKNLYGGIFKWKNKGYPIYDSQGKETDAVHAFSKKWGKLLTNAVKVYGNKKEEHR